MVVILPVSGFPGQALYMIWSLARESLFMGMIVSFSHDSLRCIVALICFFLSIPRHSIGVWYALSVF